ncbi:MAG: hypothetical protein AB4290_22525 [Spirulina sp.]
MGRENLLCIFVNADFSPILFFFPSCLSACFNFFYKQSLKVARSLIHRQRVTGVRTLQATSLLVTESANLLEW